MGFWFLMLFFDLLIPATMLGFGTLFMKRPPKDINSVFGYRTARSMKNQATWEFAHCCAGRFWVRWGWITLAGSLVWMLLLLGKTADAVGLWGGILCGVQLVPMLAVVPVTERALKRHFDQFGRRLPEE